MNKLPEPSPQPSLDPRTSRVHELLLGVVQRRLAGEPLSDQDIIAQHGDLMPELERELVKLRRIEAATRAAGGAQRTPSSDPFVPLGKESSDQFNCVILTQSQLDAPIQVSPEPGLESQDGESAPTGPWPAPTVEGYDLIAEVGHGGQAVVFEARQQSTGQRVAVKVLRSGPLRTARELSLFDREVHILATLRQRNIVGIIDRGTTKTGWSYLVMQFIEGQTLDRYVRQFQAHPDSPGRAPRQILELFLKVLAAVGAAHALGVVHRDLKPSNILIDAEGEPHVLDFGLARLALDVPQTASAAAAPVTQTGHFIGSLPYASPEQAKGSHDQVDQRTDVYSLGVILYQMLTGRFPYDVTGAVWDVVNNIVSAAPPPPSRAGLSRRKAGDPAPGNRTLRMTQAFRAQQWYRSQRRSRRLERDVDAVVLKALAKSPDSRYQSIGAFADDLKRLVDGLPVSVAERHITHHRLFLLLGGLAAAASLIWVTWWAWPRGPGIQAHSHTTQSGTPGVTGTPFQVASLTPFTNTVGMKFVRIPAGEFLMGSPDTEVGRKNDEPRHRVCITRAFDLGVTKVTQAQFRAVMGYNPSDPRYLGDDLPVQRVTWDIAVQFCTALSAREGRAYRLPSEAEWEYACRAGTQTPYAGTGRLADMGWYAENQPEYMMPVARKLPNHWGLFDMHGLVSEWCADPYGPYPVAQTPSSLLAPDLKRVVRGGSVEAPANECRAARRGVKSPGTCLATLGFRVAADVPTDQPASRPPAN